LDQFLSPSCCPGGPPRRVAVGSPADLMLRQLSHAVLDHQRGVLQDDATLLLAEWSTDAVARTMPLAVSSLVQ
jgi:hypothetical protein